MQQRRIAMSQNTIIFHVGALGDAVLTWPLLRCLVESGPVQLATHPARAGLTTRSIPGIFPLDGDSPDLSRLFAPQADQEVSDAIVSNLAAATRIISFVSDGDDVWSENIVKLCPQAQCYFIQRASDAGLTRHVTHDQQDQLAQQGLTLDLIMPELRRNIDGPVVIHPGSGSRHKCWPVERFDRLLRHFEMIGRETIILLGEVERERGLGHADPATAADWINRWKYKHDLREPASLLDLADTIATGAVFIGNDSGPTHLAAALGIPTIALFGPTDPRIWAPLGPLVHTLWPGRPTPMDWIDPEAVIELAARH